MEYFCTYSDKNYLPQLISLIRSLETNAGVKYKLYILCLDEETNNILKVLNFNNIVLINNERLFFEAPNQSIAFSNRKLINYYYTCTPVLIRLIFRWELGAERVTYLDADLYCFSNLSEYFKEIECSDIAIIEHKKDSDYNKHGRFNVSILTFNRSLNAQNCLKWWESVTFISTEFNDEVWGDQKYLDSFPEKFDNVHIIKHLGIGGAPWNINYYTLSNSGNEIKINDQKLIIYHFARLLIVNKYLFIPARRSNLNSDVLNIIYTVYFKSLGESIKIIRSVAPKYRVNYSTHNVRGLVLAILGGRMFIFKNQLFRIGFNIKLFYEES